MGKASRHTEKRCSNAQSDQGHAGMAHVAAGNKA
jgi:hypothetical protein